MLHPEGRYVAPNPHSATQYVRGNAIVHRINVDAIKEIGGLFAMPPDNPDDFGGKFRNGTIRTKISIEETTIRETLRLEPRLNLRVKHMFRVEDGCVDS